MLNDKAKLILCGFSIFINGIKLELFKQYIDSRGEKRINKGLDFSDKISIYLSNLYYNSKKKWILSQYNFSDINKKLKEAEIKSAS